MAGIRVEHAALRLVAPLALRSQAAQLRQRAENGFVPAVLHGLAARLHRRYGADAVLRLPSLRLRLRMPPSALEAGAWIERVSDDLAEQVQQMLDREAPAAVPPGDPAAMRLYHDHAHEQAVRLLAAARRERGPRGERESFERLWTGLRAAPAPERAAVLLRCGELPDAGALLARWSAAALREVLDGLPAHAPAAWRCRVDQALQAGAEAGAGWRPQRPDSAAPAGGGEPAAPARARVPDPAAPLDCDGTSSDRPADPPPAAPSAAAVAPQAPHAPQALALARAPVRGPATPQDPAPVTRRGAAARPDPQHHAPPPPRAVPSAAAPAPTDAIRVLASRWCGLPVLLNLSLRLELPERLWQIGVDEGDALAAMLARLAGADDAVLDEPAARLVSRAFPRRPAAVPPPPAWACDELAGGVAQALARWPALRGQHGALRERVTELQAWHGRGAGFDLAAWGAAWHQALAEALLDERLTPAALQARLGGAGQVVCDGDTLRVVQPLAAIDIGLRRAGLDADPGWLPWLDKRLLFVFEGPEPTEPLEP